MNDQPISIMVADDHAMVRASISTWIKTIPELSLVGEASNGEEAVSKALLLKPEVILMDLIMPKLDGIAATRQILKSFPQAKILIVTSFSEKQRAIEAIQAGVQGFILKDATLEELIEAIRAIHRGRPWFSIELARSMTEQTGPESQMADGISINILTERERDVLKLLVAGCTDQEIAGKLVIGHSTVRFHIHQILEKLQVQNRTQAALIAIRNGWASS